ncbi:His-Xaa-Ser system radical SAM maturase HxsC [Leptospira sp. 'Mane']|uniref:His-Xaa-Ser system radical SAM maturase HxsC n=1 Tax=Leptospira sp. 'Mane' TaxID=3387407 RepID=UPI00398A6B4E
MQLLSKGISKNINEPIIGRITRQLNSIDQDSILITDSINQPLEQFKGLAILSTQSSEDTDTITPTIYNTASLNYLEDGDIVSINKDGRINTQYRISSYHNTLLATERCNSNCLMCSQPPKNRDDTDHLHNLNLKVVDLIPKDCIELGISGGEPTLQGENFFYLIEHITQSLPNTEIHLLTNGRTFAWEGMAHKLAKIGNERLMLGIPLYSSFYKQHDYVVQAKDAFYQTILGLHNLAKYDQRIEIRIVLHKESIPGLINLASYIYKNLPFVEHVAFMGLEHIGYTKFNFEKLWIDPADYLNELSESIHFLDSHSIPVSIYNSQLCVLPKSLWKFARKSISDWKNDYLNECDNCSQKTNCGGFFRWNKDCASRLIKAM